MRSITKLTIVDAPKGFIGADVGSQTAWIKHLNTPDNALSVHVDGPTSVFNIVTSAPGTTGTVLGVNSMQSGLKVWATKQKFDPAKGETHWKLHVKAESIPDAEDPFSSAIVRAVSHFNGGGTSMVDARLNIIVKPRQDTEVVPEAPVVMIEVKTPVAEEEPVKPEGLDEVLVIAENIAREITDLRGTLKNIK